MKITFDKKNLLTLASSIALVAAMWGSPALSEDISFPADSGVIDVTKAPFFADPAPGTDDSVAIMSAIQSVADVDGVPVIYFPNGVYDVAPNPGDEVAIRSSRRFGRLIFQGQSETGVVIRLADSVDENFDGHVISTRAENTPLSADTFNNSIFNMTVSTGTGHPLASGVQFVANNQGTIRDVTIKTEDPFGAGNIGLDLTANLNGPLLVKNVEIEAFDVGIRAGNPGNSQTIEHVKLSGQHRAGIDSRSQATLFVRGMHSKNDVTAIDNNGPDNEEQFSRMLIIDSQLRESANANGNAAIENGGPALFFTRNLLTDGYDRAIDIDFTSGAGGLGNERQSDGCVEEYSFFGAGENRRNGGPIKLFDDAFDRSLALPIRETPDVPWDDPSVEGAWASPAHFGGVPDDGEDDSAAIRAAAKSGARTIYFPPGRWNIDESISLPGTVRRIIGTGGQLIALEGKGFKARHAGEESIVFERIFRPLGNNPRVKITSIADGDIIVRNSQGVRMDMRRNFSDWYLEDVVTDPLSIRRQNVWARQLNIETESRIDLGQPAKVTNDGGQFWVLGFKVERAGVVSDTRHDGFSELLGVFRNGPGASDSDNPFMIVNRANASSSLVSIPDGVGNWELYARERREFPRDSGDIIVKTLTGFVPGDSLGTKITRPYSAFVEPPVETDIIIDNSSGSDRFETHGAWASTDEQRGGFLGRDLLFAPGDSGAKALYRPHVPEEGEYEVFIRIKGERGGTDTFRPASNTLIRITSRNGIAEQRISQRNPLGQWVSLGSFAFSGGVDESIEILTDGANGNVIADAVRLLKDGGKRPLSELLRDHEQIIVPFDGVATGELELEFLGLLPDVAGQTVWRIQNATDDAQKVSLRSNDTIQMFERSLIVPAHSAAILSALSESSERQSYSLMSKDGSFIATKLASGTIFDDELFSGKLCRQR